MNTKKLLAAFLSAAMILGTMAVPVFAENESASAGSGGGAGATNNDTTGYITIGDGTEHYDTLQAAVDATVDANVVNGVVEYQINGKVSAGSGYVNPAKTIAANTTVKITGVGENAELALDKNDKDGANIIWEQNKTGIAVDVSNLICSRTGGVWIGNAAQLNQYFSICVQGDVTYTNCSFPNGVGAGYWKNTTFSGCTFNNNSGINDSYGLWFRTGNSENKVTIKDQSTFNSPKGIKTYSDDQKCQHNVDVEKTTFNCTDAPALTISSPGTISAKNVKFDNCTYGAIRNDSSATITIDGQAPVYAAEVDGKAFTSVKAADAYAKKENFVAKVGGTYCTTLAAAIAAAKKDDTVTLLNNVTESITIATDKEITLDLNGKTLTNNEVANTITNEGSLTICDSSNDKTGKVMNAYTQKAVLFNAGGATAVLNGGTFERDEAKTYYTIKNLGTMTINDGVTVKQLNESSAAVANGCQNQSEYTGSEVKLTINGGTFVRGLITIKNDECGVLEINGGSFTNILGNYTVFNWNKAVINGGTFDAPYVVGNGKYGDNAVGDLDITNGTFKGIICPDKSGYPSDDISISGGTFSEDVSDYCADGYVPSKNSDGTYSVFVPLAKIGDTSYPTLKDALEEVKDGETVTLLNNVTESITIATDKEITLDLNGKTLTNEAKKHTIENSGILTVTDSSESKSGVVDNVSHGKAALFNADIATAVLNGGKFMRSQETGIDQDNSGGNSWYTIANQGTLTINSGVTVENKGYFSSNIVTGNYNNKSTAVTSKLTINGGTFKGGVKTVKVDECGVLTINDGTFTNEKYACIMNWNKTEIKGGTFTSLASESVWNGRYTDTTAVGELKIAGGTFNGTVENSAKYSGGTISISGGTFKEDVSDYCADGYVSSKNSDGTYSVLVQSKKRDDNTSGGGKVTPVYTNPTYTKDIFGVEHKTHVAYINGYEDGTVKPDGNITREELAAILYRVSNDTSSVVASGNKFTDVPADRWSAGAIEFMANKKVVNGYEDGSFKPANNLTRAEFAAMVARFADLTDTAASRTFSDVDSSYWGFKSIMALNKAGYVNGYEDGTFRPEANVTRAEVMTVINKIIGRNADASYVKSLDNNRFSDLNKDSWYYVDVIEATTDHNYKLNSSGVEIEWSK